MRARKRRKRERIEPTHNWEQLVPRFEWPEQENYEVIRPLVLFGESVAERSEEAGVSERTLYRRVEGFESEGMDSLFSAEKARRKRLPPAMRRLIVDLKAEYPAFDTNETANIVYVVFGRRPDVRTIRKVLNEEAWPLKLSRDYPPYHEIEEPKERRMAIVKLHAQGWSVKAIAGYLKITRDPVYRTLKRFIEEGEGSITKTIEPVEKVVVGVVGGSKRLLKRPKTPQKQGYQP